MKDLPLAFIDLETTGTNPGVHEILEIGILTARQTQDPADPLIETGRYEFKIAPMHLETADPKALQVNHYDPSEWKDARPFTEISKELDTILKGHIFVAQNVAFDVGFLARAYESVGKSLDSVMYYHKLDLASIAIGTSYWDKTYRRFTLNELVTNSGVVNTRAHSALADAVATFEVAKKLLSRV
jgi:DNA polymerase III epsilon subunit-like protein